MIVINKYVDINDSFNTEIEINDEDIKDILSQLSWKDMVELWEEANKAVEQLPFSERKTVYDDLYNEWFDQVKEKYTLKEAEKLIPVKY